ncbi:MAG: gliding motility-associated C-terminal domain-containing protein, partial [Phaeodactylibacter sp.]|nr:gliding motility-associated C-terminal domain-containing protein [Phaeodactylibacter sp.]
EFCEGTGVQLEAVDINGNDTEFFWSNGDSDNQISVTAGGAYSVTATNHFGCKDTAWTNLVALPIPDPGLQQDAILCEGGSIILEPDLIVDDYYYLWENGPQQASWEVNAPGTYVLEVSDGTCSGQDTVEVIQQPEPEPIILGGASICPGEEATLEVLGDWPALHWSNDSDSTTITVSLPGNYTVTVEDSLGCVGSSTALVEHFATTPPELSGDFGFCPGDSARLGVEATYSSYIWSTGSTDSTIAVNTPGNYAVTVTDANGCIDWISRPVYAFGPPQPHIGGETIFCAGDSAQVFVFGSFAAYSWSNGDTTKVTAIYQPDNYSVTVTDDNGCRGVTDIAVMESPLPQPEAMGGRFCEGGSTELSVEGQYVSYLWDNGSVAPSITVDSAGLYGLTVTDQLGCTGSVNIQVEEVPLPQPVIIGGSPICLGMGATTEIAVAGDYEEIRWSTEEQTASIAVGTTDLYSVTVTDANGCSGEAEFRLQTLPAPELSILGDSAFCENESTILEAATSGISLSWSTGDTSSQVTVSQPGTYYVTAIGSNDCETTDSILVQSIALPVANAGEPQAIDCREQPVQLGSLSNPGNGLEYFWSGPGIDENNRNLSNPWVTEPGLYSLTVVQSDYQCTSAPADVMVEDLRYEPVVSLEVMDTLDCSTPTVMVSGQGSEQGSEIVYQWYDNAGELLPEENAQNLTVYEPGAYTLVVADTFTGCSSTAVAEVPDAYAYPQAEAGPEEVLTCEVTAVQLAGWVVSSSDSLVYSWSSEEGHIVEGGDGLTPLADAPGWYFLSVFDPSTGCESIDSVLVREDIEAPVADAGENQEIDCVSQEAVLDGGNSSQGPAFRYEWVNENGVPIGTSLQQEVHEPGTYSLTVTNLDNGCSSVNAVLVTEVDNYLAGMQVDAIGPLCFGESNGLISITEVQGGTPPFLYSIDGGPFLSQQQFTGLESGYYDITIQDALGCEYSREVFLDDGNDVQVRLGEDLELQLGDKVELQALTNLAPEQIRDVVWTFPIDTFPCIDPDCLIKEVQPEESTLVRATVIDSNGCSAYDELLLILRKSRSVYIPNAFSPNGDGANDWFTVFARIDEVAEVRQLMIFNRWGEQVFSRFNFPPNELHMGWDGTLDNKKLNPAVFAYFAEVEFVDGEVVLFEGSLTLVR